ncbi:MAG: Smr/MutS family protein [Pseudomonadota bacterium]
MSKKSKRTRSALPKLENDDFSFAGLADSKRPKSFVEMLDFNKFDRLSAEFVQIIEEKDERPPKPLYPPVQEELDLHGNTCVEAKVKVENFLLTARLRGLKSLRIITGKGLHSQSGPVLPDFVELLFRQMKLDLGVSDYFWENGSKENSGAIIVHL